MTLRIITTSLMTLLMITEAASAQMWGAGIYGGAQGCGYPMGMAPGAYDEGDYQDDAITELERRIDKKQEALRKKQERLRKLERYMDEAKEGIRSTLTMDIAEAAITHIIEGYNCFQYDCNLFSVAQGGTVSTPGGAPAAQIGMANPAATGMAGIGVGTFANALCKAGYTPAAGAMPATLPAPAAPAPPAPAGQDTSASVQKRGINRAPSSAECESLTGGSPGSAVHNKCMDCYRANRDFGPGFQTCMGDQPPPQAPAPAPAPAAPAPVVEVPTVPAAQPPPQMIAYPIAQSSPPAYCDPSGPGRIRKEICMSPYAAMPGADASLCSESLEALMSDAEDYRSLKKEIADLKKDIKGLERDLDEVDETLTEADCDGNCAARRGKSGVPEWLRFGAGVLLAGYGIYTQGQSAEYITDANARLGWPTPLMPMGGMMMGGGFGMGGGMPMPGMPMAGMGGMGMGAGAVYNPYGYGMGMGGMGMGGMAMGGMGMPGMGMGSFGCGGNPYGMMGVPGMGMGYGMNGAFGYPAWMGMGMGGYPSMYGGTPWMYGGFPGMGMNGMGNFNFGMGVGGQWGGMGGMNGQAYPINMQAQQQQAYQLSLEIQRLQQQQQVIMGGGGMGMGMGMGGMPGMGSGVMDWGMGMGMGYGMGYGSGYGMGGPSILPYPINSGGVNPMNPIGTPFNPNMGITGPPTR